MPKYGNLAEFGPIHLGKIFLENFLDFSARPSDYASNKPSMGPNDIFFDKIW
jgi:hypothetical protein